MNCDILTTRGREGNGDRFAAIRDIIKVIEGKKDRGACIVARDDHRLWKIRFQECQVSAGVRARPEQDPKTTALQRQSLLTGCSMGSIPNHMNGGDGYIHMGIRDRHRHVIGIDDDWATNNLVASRHNG